jgi:membrane protease YdiL (CAAX protease family)
MFEEIFSISKYPFLQKDGDFGQKLTRVLKTYGILFLMMIAIGPILMLADKLVTDVLHHKSLTEQNRQMFRQMYKRFGFFTSAFFICIIGPVFEELIFRLLLSFKKQHVAISVLVALFYFGGTIYHPHQLILKIGLEILIATVVIILCQIYIPDGAFNLSPQRKRLFIILSIILFGLMHVFNYRPIDLKIIWIYPVFVIPQLLMGWAISYTRLKNGFVWGIALHCIINMVSTGLSYHW